MSCPTCGASNAAGSAVCWVCGSSLAPAGAEPADGAQPPPSSGVPAPAVAAASAAESVPAALTGAVTIAADPPPAPAPPLPDPAITAEQPPASPAAPPASPASDADLWAKTVYVVAPETPDATTPAPAPEPQTEPHREPVAAPAPPPVAGAVDGAASAAIAASLLQVPLELLETASPPPAPAPPPPAPVLPRAEEAPPWPPVAERGGYQPILGPEDRESFFDAQRRHRRAVWRQNAVSAAAAILTGVPLSIVLSPVIYAAVVVATWLVGFVFPVPHIVWDAYRALGEVYVAAWEGIIEDDLSPEVAADASVLNIARAVVIWLAPGIMLMLLIWPALRQLFRHAGTAGVLRAVGAREPRPGDLEERQLVNVVEEMAIAGGIPAPRVMLIDAGVANAAAIGNTPEDAVLLVGRPLLDDLSRDETQGVLAHLIGSIGNGDLRAASSVLAIYQTFGLATALIKLPTSPQARRTLWRVLRLSLGRQTPEVQAREAATVAALLSTGATAESTEEQDDMARAVDIAEQRLAPRPGLSPKLVLFLFYGFIAFWAVTLLLEVPEFIRRLGMAGIVALALFILWYQRVWVRHTFRQAIAMTRAMIILPWYLATLFPQLLMWIFVPFVLEPMIGLAWRTRRYLADATAVQLTRNPDWVANGLAAMMRRGGVIPGGRWVAPLFVIGPEVQDERYLARMISERDAQLRAELERQGIDEDEQSVRRVLGELRAVRDSGGDNVARIIAEERERAAARAAAAEAAGEEEVQGVELFTSGRGMVAPYPPLRERFRRLRALGAHLPEISEQRFRLSLSRPTSVVGTLIMIPLLLLLPVLFGVLIVLAGGMALGFNGLFMLIVWALVEALAPS